jgi:prefoldin subunit 4
MSLFCWSLFRHNIVLTQYLPSYKVGEAFLHLSHANAMKRLESDQAGVDALLSELSITTEECEKEMKELKVLLYGKFGRSINLDE